MNHAGDQLVPGTYNGASSVTSPDSVTIRDAVSDILRSAPFRHSRQSQVFLTYIVKHSVAGETDLLRERVIGVEVFGRDANYDPGDDPIVRVRAAEVRKRLAQYYQEATDRPLRIEIPAGSYKAVIQARAVSQPPAPEEPAIPAAPPWFRRWRWLAAGVALLALAIVPVRALRPGTSALDRFWGPVLSSPKPVLIYNATSKVYQPARSGPSDGDPSKIPMVQVSGRYTCVGDAYMGVVLASLFSERGKLYHLRWGSDVSFSDLRYQPTILIGAFNNSWTLQTTGELRFAFERHMGIRDRMENKLYKLPYLPPDMPEPEDYALVSRVFDSKTGELLIAAGGITDYGTYAAGEFLSSPRFMEQLIAHAPADWAKRNMQVLLHTRMVGETPGPPEIVVAHFW
ncbi:MAG: hypothetical protein ABI759_31205 [Candidatus Solibacter sp.]